MRGRQRALSRRMDLAEGGPGALLTSWLDEAAAAGLARYRKSNSGFEYWSRIITSGASLAL
jgi:hypothetical protein